MFKKPKTNNQESKQSDKNGALDLNREFQKEGLKIS